MSLAAAQMRSATMSTLMNQRCSRVFFDLVDAGGGGVSKPSAPWSIEYTDIGLQFAGPVRITALHQEGWSIGTNAGDALQGCRWRAGAEGRRCLPPDEPAVTQSAAVCYGSTPCALQSSERLFRKI